MRISSCGDRQRAKQSKVLHRVSRSRRPAVCLFERVRRDRYLGSEVLERRFESSRDGLVRAVSIGAYGRRRLRATGVAIGTERNNRRIWNRQTILVQYAPTQRPRIHVECRGDTEIESRAHHPQIGESREFAKNPAELRKRMTSKLGVVTRIVRDGSRSRSTCRPSRRRPRVTTKPRGQSWRFQVLRTGMRTPESLFVPNVHGCFLGIGLQPSEARLAASLEEATRQAEL
jgi:hypothetical protein